jgi:hypothetical protein
MIKRRAHRIRPLSRRIDRLAADLTDPAVTLVDLLLIESLDRRGTQASPSPTATFAVAATLSLGQSGDAAVSTCHRAEALPGALRAVRPAASLARRRSSVAVRLMGVVVVGRAEAASAVRLVAVGD